MKTRIFCLLVVLLAVLSANLGTRPAAACSTCYSPLPTLCETIEPAQIAVFARLVKAGPGFGGVSEFRIDHVLKGREFLGDTTTANVVYFPSETQPPGTPFLILGNAFNDGNRWGSTIEVTTRSKEYISHMLDLPKKGLERLEYALPYLNDPEDLLWNDAHDEFAKSPYRTIHKLKPLLDPDDFVQRLQAITDPLEKRINLYWTLLSICATEKHVPFMEERLQEANAANCNNLNALIACYLTVVKEKGLPLIERRFLSSEDLDNLAVSNAAIAALRFHGEESDAMDRKYLIDVMIHMLDRPQLGRNIVIDLARWEVWSPLDKVAAMFESAAAAENTLWIRETVVQYLLACPLPEAKKYIERFEKMEPDLFRRKRREVEAQIAQAEPAAVPKPAAVAQNDDPDAGATKSQLGQANTAAGRDQPPHQASPAASASVVWLLVPVALLAVVVVVLIIFAARRRGVGVSEQL